jgi:peroxiredoxin Q/BCP
MLFGKSTINIGMQAPDFQLPDQDSTIHKLSDHIGSTVVLYFFPMADTPG